MDQELSSDQTLLSQCLEGIRNTDPARYAEYKQSFNKYPKAYKRLARMIEDGAIPSSFLEGGFITDEYLLYLQSDAD